MTATMPAPPDAHIILSTATLHISHGHVTTILPDGSQVHGLPHDTAEYAEHAAARGYADVADANAGHEVGHSLLAHWLGLECSPTLLRVAHGDCSPSSITNAEEDAVMAVERFANVMGVCLVDLACRT